MAEKGIRRLVQLVLDKSSVERVAKDTQRAIDKGTDPKKAKSNLRQVETGMERLRGVALKIGGALAAAFGVRALIRFGKESVRIAAESEAIWDRLALAVDNTGTSFAGVEGEIKRTARAMQDVTRVGDEDFAVILTELVTTTNDYQASLRNVSVVADLAAAKQIDMKTAAQLVGRAMVGQTSTLTRYGIIVQEGADAVQVLRDRFRGFAERDARGFEGSIARLNNEWADFKQAIGEAIIAGAEGESMLDRLIVAVKTLTEGVNLLARAWNGISETFSANRSLISNVLETSGSKEDALRRLKVIREITAAELRDAEAELERLESTGRKFWDWFYGETPRRARNLEWAREEVEGLRQTMEELERTARGLYTGAVGLGGSSGGGDSGGGGGGATGGGGPAPFPSVEGIGIVSSIGGGGGDAAGWAALNSELEMSESGAERVAAAMDRIGASARDNSAEVTDMVRRMTWAFEDGFAAVFSGMESIQDAARGIGLSIVAGLIDGKAEYHFAEAAGKLAEGLWPPNPAALASAGKHIIAGSMFAALEGLARSGGGRRRGGGAGSGGVGVGARGAAGGLAGSSGERPGPEVHIYFDGPGFSAVNPQVQRVVYAAQKLAADRYGPNATVKMHRRGG